MRPRKPRKRNPSISDETLEGVRGAIDRLLETRTQPELAKELGVDQSFISKVKSGKQKPSLLFIGRVEALMDMGPGTLSGRTAGQASRPTLRDGRGWLEALGTVLERRKDIPALVIESVGSIRIKSADRTVTPDMIETVADALILHDIPGKN